MGVIGNMLPVADAISLTWNDTRTYMPGTQSHPV